MGTTFKTHEIITTILEKIFQPEYRRLGNWIDQLCKQSREAYGDPDLIGFIYSGQVYKPVAAAEAKAANHMIKRRGLHPSLTENMEAYLQDLRVLTEDKAFISQSLFKVLDPCENNQDLRDALPNCVIDTLPSLQGICRAREQAWTIVHDERALRQFNKILPRIEMYAAARLMY